MANLFDPKNPNTWPENYKRRSTEAFTNKGVPARDLAQSQVENRFASNTQTPVYNAGGDFNLRGMQTPYENYDLKPSNLIKAGITAMGPGAAKDIINGTYLFGKNVIHGSPQRGLKEIIPTTGSQDAPNQNVVWAFNPKAEGSVLHPESAKLYSGDSGSIYVGRVPRSSINKIDPVDGILSPAGQNEPIIVSSKPIRVSGEINIENRSTQQTLKDINEALKRVGSKPLKGNKYPKPLPRGVTTDF